MKTPIQINGRNYPWPKSTLVVVCIDGSEPAYIEEAIAAGAMPFMQSMLEHGSNLRAHCVIPSFTNPNNMSIVTGVPPAVHGICGNYFIDPATGKEVMMNDPSYLRCETILAAFANQGARVAVVTAKDKLRTMLAHGLPLDSGRIVCYSSEKADQVNVTHNGIDDVLSFVGKPLPSVYSADLSEFVFASGLKLMESSDWDLMYLSTTDYIQHKHAPGTPVANAFYAMMDGYLEKIAARGATIALTADHGMKPKHNSQGSPNVVYLQSLLDEAFGQEHARVILPITDPYVVHHGALGSFAVIYATDPTSTHQIAERLKGVKGIQQVLTKAEACDLFELPPDREGDLIVVSDAEYTLGTRAENHDLSQLKEPLRSHGGTSEQTVPLLINRKIDPAHLRIQPRNFDAFYLALNC